MFLSRFLPFKSAVTFGELATQWLAHAERRLRTSTVTEYRRVLHRELMPTLASCRADKLTRRDFNTLFEGLADRPGVGWNAHAVASSIYSWAIATVRVACANPIDSLPKPRLEPRDRTLSAEEVRLVWYGVREMADYGCIVRLLLLTGCRRAEIGKLAWSEVNLAERQLELPRARTKNGRAHIVPLSPLALSSRSLSAIAAVLTTRLTPLRIRCWEYTRRARMARVSRRLASRLRVCRRLWFGWLVDIVLLL